VQEIGLSFFHGHASTHCTSGFIATSCREAYDIVESTTLIIMKDFCATIRKHLKPLVILKLIINKIKKITTSFESLHGIPYIKGATNHSLFPIIAPKIDTKSYYCQNGYTPH
jgi:hypothetical protein